MVISELKKLRDQKNLFISPDEVFRYTRLAIAACEGLGKFERAGEYKDLRELFTCALIALLAGKERKSHVVWLRPGENPPDVLWMDFSQMLPDGTYPLIRIEHTEISYRKSKPVEGVVEEIEAKLSETKYAIGTWLVCKIDYEMVISISEIRSALQGKVPKEITQVWLLFSDTPTRPRTFILKDVYPGTASGTLTEADIAQPIDQEPIRLIRIPLEGKSINPRLP